MLSFRVYSLSGCVLLNFWAELSCVNKNSIGMLKKNIIKTTKMKIYSSERRQLGACGHSVVVLLCKISGVLSYCGEWSQVR